MTRDEREEMLKIVKENIEEHLQEINWKRRHRHILSYTDKILLLTETELLMKIEEWEKENVGH